MPRRAITRALQDLAALGEVDAVIVARGGGSLADLFAFCDETLCRTVALLPVPVIASLGHHTDRTLLDDVAAVSCSTPTHAAEAAVPIERRRRARRRLLPRRPLAARATDGRAVAGRARALAAMARVPGEHIARHRRELHQDAARAARERGAALRRRARRSRSRAPRSCAASGRPPPAPRRPSAARGSRA